MSNDINLSGLKVGSVADAEFRALRDYRQVLGHVIYPQWIYGYRGESHSVSDIHANFRVGVRVVETPGDSITRFCDEFCDPEWDVEIVDDPNGLLPDLRTGWVYGQSYETPRKKGTAC